jgi:hypothetical protein
MIILSNIIVDIENFENKLENYFKSLKNLNVSLKKQGSFNIKKTNMYISDIDYKLNIIYKNNDDDIMNFIISFINFMIDNNGILQRFKTGYDTRFFPYIKFYKNMSPMSYNYKKIKEDLNKYYDNKIITKEEFDKLNKYVKNKYNNEEIVLLKKELENFNFLQWSYEELKKKEKIHRKKLITLKSQFREYPIIITFVKKIKNDYIVFDFSIILEVVKNNNKVRLYEIPLNTNKVENAISYEKTNITIYDVLFIYYVEKRYLKLLKSFKILLNDYIYHSNRKNIVDNTDEPLMKKKYLKFTRKIRNDIYKILDNNNYKCYNQIIIRISTLLFLLDKIDRLEINKLIIDIIKDCLNTCNCLLGNENNIYKLLKTKYSNENLKQTLNIYKNIIFDHYNKMVYDEVIIIYDKLKNYIPFKLKL